MGPYQWKSRVVPPGVGVAGRVSARVEVAAGMGIGLVEVGRGAAAVNVRVGREEVGATGEGVAGAGPFPEPQAVSRRIASEESRRPECILFICISSFVVGGLSSRECLRCKPG
jgi:hypothetical protein